LTYTVTPVLAPSCLLSGRVSPARELSGAQDVGWPTLQYALCSWTNDPTCFFCAPA